MSQTDRRRRRGRGQPGHGGASNQRERSLDELWPGYLKDGYFDGGGHPQSEYVAREKLVPLVQSMVRARTALTPHQARRFFQHCRAIEARLRAKTSSWDAEESKFRFLDAAAADAYGKDPGKIPRLFHDFIQRNVAQVRTEKDFLQGFLPHFEALIGFGSHFFQRERDRS